MLKHIPPISSAAPGVRGAAPARATIRSLGDWIVRHREWLWIGLLLLIAALVHGYNMFGYPYYESDEGTYVSQAWAVVTLGRLAPYTYWYDHAPGGWVQIAAWTTLTGELRARTDVADADRRGVHGLPHRAQRLRRRGRAVTGRADLWTLGLWRLLPPPRPTRQHHDLLDAAEHRAADRAHGATHAGLAQRAGARDLDPLERADDLPGSRASPPGLVPCARTTALAGGVRIGRDRRLDLLNLYPHGGPEGRTVPDRHLAWWSQRPRQPARHAGLPVVAIARWRPARLEQRVLGRDPPLGSRRAAPADRRLGRDADLDPAIEMAAADGRAGPGDALAVGIRRARRRDAAVLPDTLAAAAGDQPGADGRAARRRRARAAVSPAPRWRADRRGRRSGRGRRNSHLDATRLPQPAS